MLRRIATGLLCGLTISVGLVGSVGAVTYLPVHPHLVWDYSGEGGAIWTIAVEGEETVAGRPTVSYLLDFDLGDGPTLARYFFTADPAGNLLFHGAEFVTAGQAIALDPPVIWMPAAPVAGETTVSATFAYDNLAAAGEAVPMTFAAMVVEETDLSVPRGTYHVFGLDLVLNDTTGERPDLLEPLVLVRADARDPFGGTDAATVWHAANVGIVQMVHADRLFALTGWNGWAAVDATSWTQIKACYRR